MNYAPNVAFKKIIWVSVVLAFCLPFEVYSEKLVALRAPLFCCPDILMISLSETLIAASVLSHFKRLFSKISVPLSCPLYFFLHKIAYILLSFPTFSPLRWQFQFRKCRWHNWSQLMTIRSIDDSRPLVNYCWQNYKDTLFCKVKFVGLKEGNFHCHFTLSVRLYQIRHV